jgi:uncharacterized protein
MWSYESLCAYIRSDPELLALLEHVRATVNDDPGHDVAHCLRVALSTLRLSPPETSPRLAIAAALLHDIVNVAKDSPDRANASDLSARRAAELLSNYGFEREDVDAVTEAIRAHSFSRGEVPKSDLGRALQDADRLEALGAIGLFRTISTGARMAARYFDPEDPWAERRPLNDRAYTIDHLFTKLLQLPETLCTEAGRAEARRRAQFLHSVLHQLASELGIAPPPLAT